MVRCLPSEFNLTGSAVNSSPVVHSELLSGYDKFEISGELGVSFFLHPIKRIVTKRVNSILIA